MRIPIPDCFLLPMPTHPALALSATCLAALLFGLEISSVPIILPVLEAQLQAGFQDLTEGPPGSQQVILADTLVERARAEAFGQRRAGELRLVVRKERSRHRDL